MNVTISFGGTNWPISDSDLKAGTVSSDNTECLGAIIAGTTGSYPAWIVGDTLLVGRFQSWAHV
jgi:cathepsin D